MATITFHAKMGGEWYDINFRYDPDLVDLIKNTIPSAFRKYDPATHTWSAAKVWAQAFAQALHAAGHTTSGIPSGMSGAQASGPSGAGAFSPPHWNWAGSGAQPPPPRQPPPRSQPPPMPPKPPPALTENWAKELMRRTSPELREKVYKQLAKVLHEDLGGDGRLMQELNDARLHHGKTA